MDGKTDDCVLTTTGYLLISEGGGVGEGVICKNCLHPSPHGDDLLRKTRSLACPVSQRHICLSHALV